MERGSEGSSMELKASEGWVVIGEPVVSSAGGGGDGVQTLSPEENYERKGETISRLGKKRVVCREKQ